LGGNLEFAWHLGTRGGDDRLPSKIVPLASAATLQMSRVFTHTIANVTHMANVASSGKKFSERLSSISALKRRLITIGEKTTEPIAHYSSNLTAKPSFYVHFSA
jgi:hypothetical protein